MAGTSRKKSTSTTKKGKKLKKAEVSNESSMGSEVAILGFFAVSVLLFLSNFGLIGSVGLWLKQIQLGLFGSFGYILPFYIFFGACFWVSNRENARAVKKMVAVTFGLIAGIGLLQMMFGGEAQAGFHIPTYYQNSATSGVGGGVLGGLLCACLSVTGAVGTYLILLVVLVIAVVYITEKSLVNFVKQGSNQAYEYAKEDISRRQAIQKERKEERKEERRRLREERKVQGVNLEATNLKENPPLMREFVDGIPEGTVLKTAEDGLPDVDILDKTDIKDIIKEEPFAEEDAMEDAVMEETVTEEKTAPEEEKTSLPSVDEFHGEIFSAALNEMYTKRDTRTLSEMSFGEFGKGKVAEETPREMPKERPEEAQIVSATGKVMEADMDLMQKTLEAKRKENHLEREKEKIEQAQAERSVVEEITQKQEEEKKIVKEYIFPPLSLLKRSEKSQSLFSQDEYKQTAIKLQQTLHSFGVNVTVTNISCGPTVTRYELQPEQGVKVSKIVSLADDIKLNLAAPDIRIEAPIPGKAAVGIEVPNLESSTVLLRDILESDAFRQHKSKVAFGVGKDIGGQTVVSDIAKMPHLLIAGATGSGKSVCINTLIMSIIYKAKPEEVKLIMVDPKVVELSVYNGIPHLLIPVVTDPKKASGALNWAVAEMMERYKKFEKYGVRNLTGFNERIDAMTDVPQEQRPEKLPQIVIIVDELADLMMVAPGEVEDAICRLAQLARAAGIHLVIATQRPSVNVITGVIKANIPSRIAFSVSSGVDSRTILDTVGAEKLIGKGDMLFHPSGAQKAQRVQGAFVSDNEVSDVVEFLREQGITSNYSDEIESKISSAATIKRGGEDRDELFFDAARAIIDKDKGSIGMLQKIFRIGFNRAARIMDQLAEAGIVGEEEGTKPRKVLMSMEEFENNLEQGVF